MSIEKVSKIKPSKKAPIVLPKEMRPTVYLTQFVQWLQTSPIDEAGEKVNRVHLRFVMLASSTTDELGIVTYGEIGAEKGDQATMTLRMTSDKKLHLKGEATIYKSDQRLKQTFADPQGNFPFNPEEAGSIEIIIWAATGEISLQAKSGQKWQFLPKYVVASNLLYASASGSTPPFPMIMLSLSKDMVNSGVI
jgi:hypothetical protein